MTLSPITKVVIAIGLIGIPYLLFLAPERSSIASVSEQVEILERVGPQAVEQPVFGEAIDSPAERERIRPLDTYQATVERPLFAVSRRPYQPDLEFEPEPVQVEVEEPEEDNWVDNEFIRLVGTFQQGEEMRALISSSDHSELFTVSVGEQVSTWTLKELKSDEATLERDGTPLILKLLD